MKRQDLARLLIDALSPEGGPVRSRVEEPGWNWLCRLLRVEECELWFFRNNAASQLRKDMPAEAARWVSDRARRITASNQLVDAARDRVSACLDRGGFDHVVLKGSARRLLRQRFPLIDARASNDVDLIAPPGQAEEAWRYLLSHGYSKTPPKEGSIQRHAPLHFIPVHDEVGVSVEIHHSTQGGLSDADAWDRISHDARKVLSGEIAVPVPNETELFWHGLHHSVHQKEQAFRLRYLLDAVVMLAGDVDLDRVRRRIDGGETDDRRIACLWLSTARWLAEPWPERGVAPYPLERPLAWHLTVADRLKFSSRIATRAAEEGRRVEMGMGPVPPVPGAGPLLGIRRKAVSTVLRWTYRRFA